MRKQFLNAFLPRVADRSGAAPGLASGIGLHQLLGDEQIDHGDGHDGDGHVGNEDANAREIVAELAESAQLAVFHFTTPISEYRMNEGRVARLAGEAHRSLIPWVFAASPDDDRPASSRPGIRPRDVGVLLWPEDLDGPHSVERCAII